MSLEQRGREALLLRLLFVEVASREPGLDVLAEMASGQEKPELRTALDEPAAGAAHYALDVFWWLMRAVMDQMEKVGADLSSDLGDQLQELRNSLVHEVAPPVIQQRKWGGLDHLLAPELALLTLADAEETDVKPAVAAAAAWEAYSRSRPIARQLAHVEGFPKEAPGDLKARSRELVERVASGWTGEEDEAVRKAQVWDQ